MTGTRSVIGANVDAGPPEVWEPIQAIRRMHDRQIGRWMLRINLPYPFVPAGDVEKAVPLL